jgi:UDP-N-acetylmuramoylalanine--D-glutamate ligase
MLGIDEHTRVLVVGAGVTGRAVVRVLCHKVAAIQVADDRPEDEIPEVAAELSELGTGLMLCSRAADEISRFDLVIPSPGVPPNHETIAAAESFGIPILSEIEVAFRMCPAPILAVTGTNGKSTTVVLAARMLEAAGFQVAIAGNIKAEGLGVPLITAAAEATSDSVVVAEVSSFQLEWVEEFRPRIAVLTNLGIDHLDRHKTAAQYWAAKARMFARLGRDDLAVLSLDDPLAASCATNDARGSTATPWC